MQLSESPGNSLYTFADEGGRPLPINEHTFLMFVDETGSEHFSDSNYPIFGLGGCGVPAIIYSSTIIRPWCWLKDKLFDGHSHPLHAADLDATVEQIGGLNKFFSKCAFGRVAAVLSDKTAFNLADPEPVYHYAVRVFLERLLQVLDATEVSDVLIIQESSERTNKLAREYFPRYPLTSTVEDGAPTPVPVQYGFMNKRGNEPGLEVADFIVHTAGTCVRARLEGRLSTWHDRPDFQAVFNSGNPQLCSFLEVTRIEKRN